MSRFTPLCALLAGLALLACLPAARSAGAPAENDTQKIVYLGERGPILIELHVRIDGQSFRARHQAFIDKVFDYLDRDKDGVLSRSEALAAPTKTTLISPLAPFLGRRLPGPGRLAAGDGKVTRERLAAYYRRTGLPAFQIGGPALQPVRGRAFLQDNEPTAEQLTDRLFQLLDSDGDGKLSRRELEAAPAVLGKLDVNEDEMLGTAEVMGEANGSGEYVPTVAFGRRQQPVQPVTVLRAVAGGPEDEALARALLERYGKPGDEALPAARLGLSKEALALLDRDRDGKLSLAELARFAARAADVTLTLRLGERSDDPPLTLHRDRPLPAGVQVKAAGESVTLQLGTTRLDLRASGQVQRGFQPNVRGQFKTLFRRFDRDSKGYLEKKDIGRGSPFADTFAAMDRDGDGKVTEKEMLAWFDQMEALGKLAERSCVSLTFSNEGKGLFDLLDSDGDGRLSVRELRNAPNLLTRLGVGRDGKLTRNQVPRHHQAGLSLGPTGGDDAIRRVAVFGPRRGLPDRRGPRARGPLWFQKMDRNRDGDVSRKEFLGTDEQFRQIDTDGDGLISIAEAEAYDKRPRRDSSERTERRRR